MSKDTKKKKKVGNVISNVIAVFLLLLVGYQLITKFTGKPNFFGYRSDAVTSYSMSYKNEDPEVQSFLQGHDDQFDKGAMLYSKPLTDDMELKVYDIVIFDNVSQGHMLTAHRIVRIDHTDSGIRYIIRADTAKSIDYDGSYPRSYIYAKVEKIVPGIGHFYLFFNSVYGVILEIGLLTICVIYDILSSELEKKKEEPVTDVTPLNNEDNPQDNNEKNIS